MQLAMETDPGVNLVRRYGEGSVLVGEQHITQPFIVGPRRLVLEWTATSIVGLTEGQLEPLELERGGVVLLGAGETQPWASATVRRWFLQRGIGLECMNLGAACRTYNVLAQEQRIVIAGLFP